MNKQKLFRNKSRKPYWGVLAPDVAHQTFRRPDNFMSLLQTQYQNARRPGNDKPDQRLEDNTI